MLRHNINCIKIFLNTGRQFISEALQVLNNIRTFRVKVRETDLATLEEMVEKLSVIIEERREEENAARREQEKHQAKLDAFRQRMLEDGIDPAELLSLTSPLAKATIKSRRAPRPAKYKYTDENGNEQTWTGQGRTPKTILEEGKSLEDFAI